MSTTEKMSPQQAAEFLGKSRASVIKLIEAGDLVATDERSPGSDRPYYRVAGAELGEPVWAFDHVGSLCRNVGECGDSDSEIKVFEDSTVGFVNRRLPVQLRSMALPCGTRAYDRKRDGKNDPNSYQTHVGFDPSGKGHYVGDYVGSCAAAEGYLWERQDGGVMLEHDWKAVFACATALYVVAVVVIVWSDRSVAMMLPGRRYGWRDVLRVVAATFIATLIYGAVTAAVLVAKERPTSSAPSAKPSSAQAGG